MSYGERSHTTDFTERGADHYTKDTINTVWKKMITPNIEYYTILVQYRTRLVNHSPLVTSLQILFLQSKKNLNPVNLNNGRPTWDRTKNDGIKIRCDTISP